jgi:hypothetical protein
MQPFTGDPVSRLRAAAAQAGVIVAVAAAIACDSSTTFGPSLARVDQAESTWTARPFADYSYEIQTLCFCPPEIVRWTRVSVRNGAVVGVEPVEADPALPITSIALWKPIDTLFANLRHTLANPSSRHAYAEIVAEFDPVLGYPVLIEYRAHSNIADGGLTHHLRNVTPLD